MESDQEKTLDSTSIPHTGAHTPTNTYAHTHTLTSTYNTHICKARDKRLTLGGTE